MTASAPTLPLRATPVHRGGPPAHPLDATPFADVLAAAGSDAADSDVASPNAAATDTTARGAGKTDTPADPTATPAGAGGAADPASLLAQLGVTVPAAQTAHPHPADTADTADTPAGQTTGSITASPGAITTPSPTTTPPTSAPSTAPATAAAHRTGAGPGSDAPNMPANTGDAAAERIDRPRVPARTADRTQRPPATAAAPHDTGAAYLATAATTTTAHRAEAVSAPAEAVRTAEPQPALVAAVSHLRLRGDGTHGLSAMLHPADLGAVRVHATLHGDQLTLVVACANDAARAAVTAALPDLHHQLGGIGSIDVQLGDRQAGRDARADTQPRDTLARDAGDSSQHGAQERDRAGRTTAPRTRPTTVALDQWM